MITFKQLKSGPCSRVSGLSVTSCDFLRICNDAVRQLLSRGNWWNTVVPVKGCVRGNTVTWPRGVATILGLDICGHPTILANRWYQFLQPDRRWQSWATQYSRRGWAGQLVVESYNTSPVFNPIVSEGFSIRTFVTSATDAGKTITFYGVDVNGQPIVTTRADGTVQNGVQVTLAVPYVDTPMAIRHVSRVVKDETDADVICYQHNIAGDFLLDLGRYQATETCPEYVTSVVRGCRCDDGCSKQVEALVSVRFVPFKYDGDLVQIDCEDAIRDMILSIRKKESGDIAGSLAYETSAIRELNFQMKSQFPDEQFFVNFRPFGKDDLNNCETRIGAMI